MKQFKTLLKVKSLEETSILEKLRGINEVILQIDERINSTYKNICHYKSCIESCYNASEQVSLRSIIQSLHTDINNEKIKREYYTEEKEIAQNSLLRTRQEIKSIEKLLAKREEELRTIELRKEQEFLDELNTLD